MTRVINILRFLLVVIGVFVLSNSAYAVSAKKSGPKTEMGWVTTGAAARAHSDVQLRRLLSVFAEKNDEEKDQLFDQIKQLRKVRK